MSMSNAEAAAEEVEVLSSIYGDCFEHAPSAWNYPSFRITITSAETKSSAQLLFTLTKRYPRAEGPKVEVCKSTGLSELEAKSLSKELLSFIKKVSMCSDCAVIAQ
jgi:primosomal protein N'